MADRFKPCSVEGCNGNAHSSARGSRGYCNIHYQRLMKHGGLNHGRFTYAEHATICSVDGCLKPAIKRTYCSMHYQRWRKLGDPTAGRNPNGSLIKWILNHVSYEGPDCLPWPFGTNPAGYGVVRYSGKSTPAPQGGLWLHPPETSSMGNAEREQCR